MPLHFTNYLMTLDLLDTVEKQTHEKIRADGIALESFKERPFKQIIAWAERQNSSKKIQITYLDDILHYFAWFIIIIMFFSGYGMSSALLEYGGEQLVNVFGFFLILIFIPFVLSIFTLLFLLIPSRNTRHAHSVLKLLITLFRALPFASKEKLQTLLKHQNLLKNLSINYLQYGSIMFSLGSLTALIVTISTQDIAFGWGTTLQITPEMLHNITEIVVLPWQIFFPASVPSLELIEMSHHYRLGNQLDHEIVINADLLGAWWQFLALSIVVWTLLPRAILLYLAKRDLQITIEKAVLSHPNASLLLRQMNEIYITTNAANIEERHHFDTVQNSSSLPSQPILCDTVIGWSINQDQLPLMLEAKQIMTEQLYYAGGKNSLSEDSKIISLIDSSVLILVKAWEPPMRDFLDFVNELYLHNPHTISVLPIGTPHQHFLADASDIMIWKSKIASLQEPQIGIYHAAH